MAEAIHAEFATTNAAGLYALGDLARQEKFLFRQYERIHNYLYRFIESMPV